MSLGAAGPEQSRVTRHPVSLEPPEPLLALRSGFLIIVLSNSPFAGAPVCTRCGPRLRSSQQNKLLQPAQATSSHVRARSGLAFSGLSVRGMSSVTRPPDRRDSLPFPSTAYMRMQAGLSSLRPFPQILSVPPRLAAPETVQLGSISSSNSRRCTRQRDRQDVQVGGVVSSLPTA